MHRLMNKFVCLLKKSRKNRVYPGCAPEMYTIFCEELFITHEAPENSHIPFSPVFQEKSALPGLVNNVKKGVKEQ